MVSLFVVGFAAGVVNPEDPGAAGERAGEALAMPLFLIASFLFGMLTDIGTLPGTNTAAISIQ